MINSTNIPQHRKLQLPPFPLQDLSFTENINVFGFSPKDSNIEKKFTAMFSPFRHCCRSPVMQKSMCFNIFEILEGLNDVNVVMLQNWASMVADFQSFYSYCTLYT